MVGQRQGKRATQAGKTSSVKRAKISVDLDDARANLVTQVACACSAGSGQGGGSGPCWWCVNKARALRLLACWRRCRADRQIGPLGMVSRDVIRIIFFMAKYPTPAEGQRGYDFRGSRLIYSRGAWWRGPGLVPVEACALCSRVCRSSGCAIHGKTRGVCESCGSKGRHWLWRCGAAECKTMCCVNCAFYVGSKGSFVCKGHAEGEVGESVPASTVHPDEIRDFLVGCDAHQDASGNVATLMPVPDEWRY